MKDMAKKFVAFLLATVMVSQLSVTAFAEVKTAETVKRLIGEDGKAVTASFNEANQEQYADVTGPDGKPDGTVYLVELGDSIAAGMGTSGTEGFNNSNAQSTYDNPIETSYPYMHAQQVFEQLKEAGYFGGNVEFPTTPAAVTGENGKSFKWANFGIAGYRLNHFIAILTGDKSAFTPTSDMDEMWWSMFWRMNHGMNNKTKRGIQQADVITVNLGSNDVLQHFLTDMFDSYVHSKTGNKADCDAFTEELYGVLWQQISALWGEEVGAIDTTALKEAAKKVEVNPLILSFAAAYFLLFMLSLPLETVLLFVVDMLAILEPICPIDTEDFLEFLTFVDQKNIERKLDNYINDAKKDYDKLIETIKEVNPKASISVMSSFTPYGTSLYGNTTYGAIEEVKYNLPYVTKQIYDTLVDTLFENKEDAKFDFLSDSALGVLIENEEAKLGLKDQSISTVLSVLSALEELGLPADEQLEWFFNVLKTANDIKLENLDKAENLNDLVRTVLKGNAVEFEKLGFVFVPNPSDELVEVFTNAVNLIVEEHATAQEAVALAVEGIQNLTDALLNPTETTVKLVLQSLLVKGVSVVAKGLVTAGVIKTAIDYYNYVTNYDESYMKEIGYELPAWIALDDLQEWAHAQLYITAYFSEILSGKEVKHSAIFDIDNTDLQMPFKFVGLDKEVTEGYEKGLKGVLQFLGEVADRVFGTTSKGAIVTNFQKMIQIFSAFRSGDGNILELQNALQDIADSGIVFTLAFGNEDENTETGRDIEIEVPVAELIKYISDSAREVRNALAVSVGSAAAITREFITSYAGVGPNAASDFVIMAKNEWDAKNVFIAPAYDPFDFLISAGAVREYAVSACAIVPFTQCLKWIDENILTERNLAEIDIAECEAIKMWQGWLSNTYLFNHGSELLNEFWNTYSNEALFIGELLGRGLFRDLYDALGNVLEAAAGTALLDAGALVTIGNAYRVLASMPLDILINIFTPSVPVGYDPDTWFEAVYEKLFDNWHLADYAFDDLIESGEVAGLGMSFLLEAISSTGAIAAEFTETIMPAVFHYIEDATMANSIWLKDPSLIGRTIYGVWQAGASFIVTSAAWAAKFVAAPLAFNTAVGVITALHGIRECIDADIEFAASWAIYFAQNMGISLAAAREFMDNYIKLIRGVDEYLWDMTENAARLGFNVANILGANTLELLKVANDENPLYTVTMLMASGAKLLKNHFDELIDSTKDLAVELVDFVGSPFEYEFIDPLSLMTLETEIIKQPLVALEVIIRALEDDGTYPLRYLMAGIPVRNAMAKFNVAIEEIANKYGVEYVDIFGIPASALGSSSAYSSWNPHPNDAGHAYMTEQLDNSFGLVREAELSVNGSEDTITISSQWAGKTVVTLSADSGYTISSVDAVEGANNFTYSNGTLNLYGITSDKINVIATINSVGGGYSGGGGGGYSGGGGGGYSGGGSSAPATKEPVKVETVWNDIDTARYYYEPMQWNYEEEIMAPVADDKFGIGLDCSRSNMYLALYKIAGSPKVASNVEIPFEDVDEGSEYYDAVRWAYANGYTTGTTATTFEPGMTLDRAQIVTILWRYDGSNVEKGTIEFNDVEKGRYYEKAVDWSTANGVINGTAPGKFSPAINMVKESVITMLYRYFVEPLAK